MGWSAQTLLIRRVEKQFEHSAGNDEVSFFMSLTAEKVHAIMRTQ